MFTYPFQVAVDDGLGMKVVQATDDVYKLMEDRDVMHETSM